MSSLSSTIITIAENCWATIALIDANDKDEGSHRYGWSILEHHKKILWSKAIFMWYNDTAKLIILLLKSLLMLSQQQNGTVVSY